MRHGQISRNSAKTLLAVIAIGVASACADTVTSPAKVVTAKAPAAYSTVVGVTSFLYTPDSGVTQRFGDHVIVIPANGICDPETSGYGKDYWDAPCDAVDHPITITATSYADPDGRPYVDFQPALRFVPDKPTILYLHDGHRDKADLLAIWYCDATLTCENEALTDSTLAMQRIGKSANVFRRIKHFSGYNIAAIGDCTDGTVSLLDDGSLFCDTGSSIMSRSGYILASGLGKGSAAETFGRRKRTPSK